MAKSKKAGPGKKKAPKPKAAKPSRAKKSAAKPAEVVPSAEQPTTPAAAPPPTQPTTAQAAPAQPSTPRGPICQSCGMPMDCKEKFGRNADGGTNRDYCAFCFENGAFRRPDMTLPQMVDRVAGIIVQATGLAQDAARAKAWGFLPQLKRWHP